MRDPELVATASRRFGAQCVVVAIDARRAPGQPSGFEVVVDGGRTATGRDAVAWAAECERLGAGELLVTSIDRDGTRDGYDLPLTRAIRDACDLPLIASGGAGAIADFVAVFREADADAALAASLFHYAELSIADLKDALAEAEGSWCRARAGAPRMSAADVRWDANGLAPVVIADAATARCSTLAYANREALERTLASGSTWLWSRSRGELWNKGATSGNTQRVVSVALDCDGDALLYRVIPNGPACHTGAPSCFSDAAPARGCGRHARCRRERRTATARRSRAP